PKPSPLGLKPVLQALGEPGRRRLARDQVVERSKLDPALDQLFFVPVRQDDHRDVLGRGIFAQSFEHAQAIELGQPNVQKDDVRVQSPCFFQRHQTVAGDVDRVPVKLELEPVHLSHGCIVLDDEDPYIIRVCTGPLIQFPSLHFVQRLAGGFTTGLDARNVSVSVPLRLRPLEIGDMLDETFRMYRRHFLLFAGISLLLAIPSAALYGLAFAWFSVALRDTTGTDLSYLTPLIATAGAGFLVTLVILPFTNSAVMYAACESALGRPVTLGGVFSGILRRYFPLLGYW